MQHISINQISCSIFFYVLPKLWRTDLWFNHTSQTPQITANVGKGLITSTNAFKSTISDTDILPRGNRENSCH